MIMEFLRNNYIYFVIVIVFIILALIGYMVDKAKTNKIKKQIEEDKKSAQLNIPVANANFAQQHDMNVQTNNDNK